MSGVDLPTLLNVGMLSQQIQKRLNILLTSWLPSIKRVDITTPGEEDFLETMKFDGLMPIRRGKIEIQPREDLPALILQVPMPFQGIFVHNKTLSTPLGRNVRNTIWTWCPWLDEACGARLVRGNTHRERVSYRIGTGGGRYLEVPLTDEKGNLLSDTRFWNEVRPSFFSLLIQTPDQIPEALQQIIRVDTSGPLMLLSPREMAYEKQLLAIREYALDRLRDKDTPRSDLDDLDHRMLMTYNIWLTVQVVNQIWLAALRTMRTAGSNTPDKIWELILHQEFKAIESALFKYKDLLHGGRLHAFRPTNPIDAISQLTQLKRYDIAPQAIDHLPAVYHQNHPSFCGRICPVETPESEALGISLHLAKGAFVDELGRIHPCKNEGHGLGWAASTIPFFEHNDAVRNMMGAKNLKQTLPVVGRRAPSVYSGEECEMLDAIKPLVKLGVVPDMCDTSGNLSPGIDLLVAYMPYYGLNFEDAIVANRSLADDRLLDFFSEEELSFRIRPGFAVPFDADAGFHTNASHSIKSQLAEPGTRLLRGTELARLWHATSGHTSTILYKSLEQADLLDISLDYDTYFGGKLVCHVRKHYPIGPGDKLMGRHGNKGVISALLADDEMPRLPDSENLPESMRNRAVDLILNPHGVISRMNIAQLMETHLGWLLNVSHDKNEKTFKINCKPFAQKYASFQREISTSLKSKGLDEYGRTRLVLPNGLLTEMPVVVGFQHIVRLRHIPTLKSQSRGHKQTAKYDIRTGQAVRGRRLEGGQRVGEMELWALSTHCANHVISEILRIKSDFETFTDTKKRAEYSTTWTAIHDHLFALGVNADFRDNKISFGWLPDESDTWSSGHITSSKDSIPGLCSVFQCPRCNYHPPVDNLFFHRSNERYVILEQVLREIGLGCPLQPISWHKTVTEAKGTPRFEGIWVLPSLEKGDDVEARVVCEEHRTDIAIQMNINHNSFPKCIELTARGRKPDLGGEAGKKTKIGFTIESISGISVTNEHLPIGKLRVTCAIKHPSLELRPVVGTTKQDVLYTADGLFSPPVFGDICKITSGVSSNKWGSIPLSRPLKYPFEAFLTVQQRRVYQKEGKLPNDFPDPSRFPKIECLPVLPLRYRLPQYDKMRNSRVLDINDLYREILEQAKFIEVIQGKLDDLSLHLNTLTEKLSELNIVLVEKNNPQKESADKIKVVIELLLKEIVNDNIVQTLLTSLPARMTRMLQHICKVGLTRSEIRDFIENITKRKRLFHEIRNLCDLDYVEQNLRNRLIKLFETLFQRLSGRIPKEGMLRRHGLGRRVDCSGRLVIIPDPELTPDKVKVPIGTLWEIMLESITTWLEQIEQCFMNREKGVSPNDPAASIMESAGVLDSYIAIKEGKILNSVTARKLRRQQISPGELVEDKCFLTLQKYLRSHPEKVILLNRQPSLHKYSILAFHPVPTLAAQGEVMRISPLVCGAFGADFDGDEMALHWPLTDKAQQEAKGLLFGRNLLSEATGFSTAHYSQDIVLGVYWIKRRGHESEIYELLPDHNLKNKCCQAILKDQQDWNRGVGLDLIQHLCVNHPQDAEHTIWRISKLGFRAATEAGVSFGYFDLIGSQSLSEKIKEQVIRIEESVEHTSIDPEMAVKILGSEDKKLEKLTLEYLPRQDLTELTNSGHPGLGLSAIALSQARGTSQTKQLIAMRGFLSPGSIGFDESPKSFFFKHSLQQGCDKATYFMTTYNARSSMCDKKIGTAQAGNLTRQLIAALWNLKITEDDCGISGDRNPLNCIAASGICQMCYGTAVNPNADYIDRRTGLYAIGYPAGLVAGQSLGERGTQLTMQSFHTGKRVFTTNTVFEILNNPGFFSFDAFCRTSPDYPPGMDEKHYQQCLERIYELVPQPSDNELADAIKEAAYYLAKLSRAKDKNNLFKKNLIRCQHAVNDMNSSFYNAHQALLSNETQIQQAARDCLLVLGMTKSLRKQATIKVLEKKLATLFVARFSSIPAYSMLQLRHIQLLWRTIHGSENSKLSGTRIKLPPLAALGFCSIRRKLLWAAVESEVDLLEHPASRIMVGLVMREI